MRLPLLLLFAAVAVPATAQTPRLEIFGGGSLFHATEVGIHQTFYDGQGEVSLRVWRGLAVVGDFGEQRRPVSHTILYNIQGLAGLEYGFHHKHVSYFVHGLGGYARTGVGKVTVTVCCTDGTASTVAVPGAYSDGYAVAAGGGADLTLTRLLAIRGMVDWLPEREHGPWIRNEYRVGIGLVIRFGNGPRKREGLRDTPKPAAAHA